MIRTLPERIIPLNEASERLAEILQTLGGDQIWIVAEEGAPKAAIVDAQFLEKLLRRVWFDELAAKTTSGFSNYLEQQGLDPEKMTEEEIEAILQK